MRGGGGGVRAPLIMPKSASLHYKTAPPPPHSILSRYHSPPTTDWYFWCHSLPYFDIPKYVSTVLSSSSLYITCGPLHHTQNQNLHVPPAHPGHPILVCRDLRSFWGASVRPAINFKGISGSQADLRMLDNIVLARTSDILVRIYRFSKNLSNIYNRKLDLHS